MNKIIFTIPRLTPSENRLLRMHWRKLHQERSTWAREVLIATNAIDYPKAKKGERRKVEITSYRVSLLDPVNFVGGLKHLEDALVDFKLIWDDNMEHEELRPKQEKVKKRALQRTEVTVSYP